MISLYISSEDGITPKIFSFKLKQNFHLEPVFIIVYNHGEFITLKSLLTHLFPMLSIM